MKQRPMVMSIATMVGATERSKATRQRIIDHARSLEDDPDRAERRKVSQCVNCYYGSRIGGQAFTNRDCMSCGAEQTYSSTATDVLCMPCAHKHQLCKRCGGDVELRARRRDWPTQTTGGAK